MSKSNFVELEPLNKNLGESALVNLNDIAVVNCLNAEDKKMYKCQDGTKCLFRCGAVLCFTMTYSEFKAMIMKGE